jgi:hypothetical protein
VPDTTLVGLFVAPIAGGALRYFVTGGYAALIDGEPLFTRDIDLVIARTRRVQSGALDDATIAAWAHTIGVTSEWERAKRTPTDGK